MIPNKPIQLTPESPLASSRRKKIIYDEVKKELEEAGYSRQKLVMKLIMSFEPLIDMFRQYKDGKIYIEDGEKDNYFFKDEYLFLYSCRGDGLDISQDDLRYLENNFANCRPNYYLDIKKWSQENKQANSYIKSELTLANLKVSGNLLKTTMNLNHWLLKKGIINFEQLKILRAILRIMESEKFLSVVKPLYEYFIVNEAFYRPYYLSDTKLWTNERPPEIDKMLFIYGSNQIETISNTYRKVYKQINVDEFDLSAWNKLYEDVVKAQLEIRGQSKLAQAIQQIKNAGLYRKGAGTQYPERDVAPISKPIEIDEKTGKETLLEECLEAPEESAENKLLREEREKQSAKKLNKILKHLGIKEFCEVVSQKFEMLFQKIKEMGAERKENNEEAKIKLIIKNPLHYEIYCLYRQGIKPDDIAKKIKRRAKYVHRTHFDIKKKLKRFGIEI